MKRAKLELLSDRASGPSFDEALARHGLGPLTRGRVTTLQINVGKRCNMACHHCHVEAGPKRTEMMSRETVERLCELITLDPAIEVVDVTGGAPELNPHFMRLVEHARHSGKAVIDRCNLSVLLTKGMEHMAGFLAEHGVRIVASLPCYQRGNVDKQRGKGAFDDSINALRMLNALGYGRSKERTLDLVYNPGGAALPPPQAQLEADYKRELKGLFDIDFDRLLTLTNMPIKRFADMLEREGKHDAYMSLLVNHFNPATVADVMCRSLVSVSWDGRLFDCDFNQMLELPPSAPRTIWDVTSFRALEGAAVATGAHCFGCTAGAGSSCSGALA